MIKTAVFVEGQTELIFTRELILKFFEYQDIWIECYTLFNDQDLNPTEYSFRTPDANLYFQIHNIGNDKKVISTILKREKYLFSENQSFDRVVGLRDMYSKEYREIVQNSMIDTVINQKFIDSHRSTITKTCSHHEKINFHFAIMELEAWLLGIRNLFEKFNPELHNERIKAELGIDLSIDNIESIFFHPANSIDRILKIVGDGYDKKKTEVNKFMGRIEKSCFLDLLTSNKCSSFNSYCNSLQIII